MAHGGFSLGVADVEWHGHKGGKKTAPGADDTEPVIQVPVGLPCLERGRHAKKEVQQLGERGKGDLNC